MHSVCYFSCYQFSPSVVSNSLQLHGLQHARLPCPSSTPGAYSNSCLSSQWCRPSSHPLLSPSPPAFNFSQLQGLFQWVSSSHQVAKVSEFLLQHQSFQWIFRTGFLLKNSSKKWQKEEDFQLTLWGQHHPDTKARLRYLSHTHTHTHTRTHVYRPVSLMNTL